MEGARRSSAAALLFLALVLTAGNFGTVAQLHPPAGKRYMLVALLTSRGSHGSRFAMGAAGESVIGFSNKKHQWFAVTGSESLLSHGSSYRQDIPGQGLVSLLGALVNNGTR